MGCAIEPAAHKAAGIAQAHLAPDSVLPSAPSVLTLPAAMVKARPVQYRAPDRAELCRRARDVAALNASELF